MSERKADGKGGNMGVSTLSTAFPFASNDIRLAVDDSSTGAVFHWLTQSLSSGTELLVVSHWSSDSEKH